MGIADTISMKNRAFNDSISLWDVLVGICRVVGNVVTILFAVALVVGVMAWEIVKFIDKVSKPKRRRRSYW